MLLFRCLWILCLISLSFSSQAECVRLEVAAYAEKQYYSSTVGLEGEKLKLALHNLIANHHRQELACIPTVLGEDVAEDSREFHYLWPKNVGFPDDIQDAHSDAHNLWRSIKPTELVDRIPQKDVPLALRGDYARTLFYMAIRYQGNDSSLTPDLELVPGKPEKETPHLGGLCLLLDWHQADPVSGAESRRNNRIYDWQGNRNPFVDHPKFAAEVWGNTCLRSADKTAKFRSVLQRLEEIEIEIKVLKRKLLEMM